MWQRCLVVVAARDLGLQDECRHAAGCRCYWYGRAALEPAFTAPSSRTCRPLHAALAHLTPLMPLRACVRAPAACRPADPSHIHDFMPSSQDLVFDCIRVTWVAMIVSM